ncbi:MAG: DUF3810 family protein [Acidobacteria bacterium]|nr:DUF3810 family protein [Acidobacteriota bacterium]
MRRAIKIVLIAVAVAVAVTPLPRAVVERVYSRGFYAFLQPRLTPAGNETPLALFDVALLIVGGTVLAMWIAGLLGARRGMLRSLPGLIVDTAAIAAVVYLWFLAAWGLNYQRLPLRTQFDFQESRITRDALRTLAARNVGLLNSQHGTAHRSGWPEMSQTAGLLDPAFSRAQRELGMGWQAAAGRPKRSLLNFYFTRVSVDGMTDPFFLETLANQSLLPFERPFVVAHEWGHLAGYADESEASFIGWLICMRGPVSAQYSAWLSLYATVFNALPSGDRSEIARDLQQGPRDDLRAIAERLRRQTVPAASRAGYALYDRFLRANRVQAGIRSYDEVLRLLLGTRFTEDGAPVLRGN